MLPVIVVALIPVLVQEIEKIMGGGGTGPAKRDWVVGLVNEIMPIVTNRLPNWVKLEAPTFNQLVIDALETAVDKMEAAGLDAGGKNSDAQAPEITVNPDSAQKKS